MNTRLFAATVGILTGAIAVAPSVHAQEANSHFPEPTEEAAKPPEAQSYALPKDAPNTFPDEPPRVPLTLEQLNAFADLVGDSRDIVSVRLLSDPGMLPLATAATEARIQRQRRGRKMAILGFTGFGVGAAAGLLGGIVLSNFDSSKRTQDDECGCGGDFEGLLGLELIVIGVVLGVGGLVVGVIGTNKLTEPSEAESKVLERYDPLKARRPPAMPPSYSFARPTGSAGKPLSLPLLSLTF
jgi:MFS family permease